MFSGFDDYDMYYVISVFCVDFFGVIFMGEGMFLYINVEIVYGIVCGINGGFYWYNFVWYYLECIV